MNILRFASVGRSLNLLSRSVHTNREILKLVPNTGKVNLVDTESKLHKNVKLDAYLTRQLNRKTHQVILVAQKKHELENHDPLVTCKVVPILATSNSSNNSLEWKKKKQSNNNKTGQIKEVKISWNIAKGDLLGQKKVAIESILTRGHKAEIVLAPPKRSPPPTSLDLEKRREVVELCRAICEEELQAQEFKPPQGSIDHKLVLSFTKTK